MSIDLTRADLLILAEKAYGHLKSSDIHIEHYMSAYTKERRDDLVIALEKILEDYETQKIQRYRAG